MNFFLTTGNLYGHFNPPDWLKSHNKIKGITCVEEPELADIIIFAETHPEHDPYYRNVIKHPVYRKFKEKCVLYHDADLSITTLPTISPSIESWQYDSKHKRSFHYIARMSDNDAINNALVNYQQDRKYLYSFVGARTHKIRNELFNLKHPDDTFLNDRTGTRAWELNSEDKLIYEQHYCNISNESYFILAPRGIGPCTYRLFESMQIGRVPVIISDAWVKIPGIDWDKFSITVPECQILLIPQILNERKKDAVEMGKVARQIWEEHFSPEISLQKITIAAKELLQHKYSLTDYLKDQAQFFRSSYHFKNLLRYKKNQLKKKLFK